MTSYRTSMPIRDAMVPPSHFRKNIDYGSQQRGREIADVGALQPRVRSVSGSRSRVRSTDLVQGVYDRLGVARRGTWTKTPVSQEASDEVDPILGSSSVIENSTNSNSNSTGDSGDARPTCERSPSFRDLQKNFAQSSQSTGRGRSEEIATTDESRSRSLSRGRVASRWPPANGEGAGAQSSNVSVSETSKKPSWRGMNGNHNSTQKINANSTTRSKLIKTGPTSNLSPTHTSSTRLNSAKSPKQVPTAMMVPNLETEESNPEDAAEQANTTESSNEAFASVKERMRRYSGTGAKTTGNRPLRRENKPYASTLSTRHIPPKINIYGSNKMIDHSVNENDLGIADEKKDDDAGDDLEVTAPPKFSSVQSRASTYAKDHNLTTRTDISLSSGRFKAANKVSNSYLSSLQTSPKPQSKAINGNGPTGDSQSKLNAFAAPVAEISTQLQDTGNDNDGSSIAMSSVSQDDLVPPTTPSTKRTMWQNERNRVKAITPAPVAMDPAVMNKMIDDRVQAHIADMETRLGAQMRRFMQQMDDKILERLEKMEGKLRDLQDAVESKRSLGRIGQPMYGVRL